MRYAWGVAAGALVAEVLTLAFVGPDLTVALLLGVPLGVLGALAAHRIGR